MISWPAHNQSQKSDIIIIVIHRSTGLRQMHIPQLTLIIDGKEESRKEWRSFLKKWLSLTLLAQRPQPRPTPTVKVWQYKWKKCGLFQVLGQRGLVERKGEDEWGLEKREGRSFLRPLCFLYQTSLVAFLRSRPLFSSSDWPRTWNRLKKWLSWNLSGCFYALKKFPSPIKINFSINAILRVLTVHF